jgi:hypothetical protein
MATWQEQLGAARAKAGPLATYQETNVPPASSPPAPGWGQQLDIARARAGAPFPDSQGYNRPAIAAGVDTAAAPAPAAEPATAPAPVLRTGANAPVYGSSGPRSALDVLDPMENVRSDVSGEWRRGMANGGPAVAAGLAAREAVVSPISRAMGAMSAAVKPAGNAIGNFGTALVSGQPPAVPAAAPAPAVATTPTGDLTSFNDPDEQKIAVADVARQGGAAPAAGASPAIASGVPLIRRVTMLPDEPNPGIGTPAAADPTTSILAQLNNGTWSGMMNAHTMARRLDADRQAAVAQQQADIAGRNADTSRLGAETQEQNAVTAASRASSENAHTAAIAEGMGYDNKGKKQLSDLEDQYAKPRTDPQKKRELGDQILTMKGKDPRENQFKIAQYEEPIDPANPMAGTRKVPLMIDAQGRVQAISPPGARQARRPVARAVPGRSEEGSAQQGRVRR